MITPSFYSNSVYAQGLVANDVLHMQHLVAISCWILFIFCYNGVSLSPFLKKDLLLFSFLSKMNEASKGALLLSFSWRTFLQKGSMNQFSLSSRKQITDIKTFVYHYFVTYFAPVLKFYDLRQDVYQRQTHNSSWPFFR